MNARNRTEQGASSVEYSLLATAIAAILVAVVFAIGSYTGAMFTSTCASMQSGDFGTSASCP